VTQSAKALVEYSHGGAQLGGLAGEASGLSNGCGAQFGELCVLDG
jgi:hypothetical protein